MAGLLTYNGIEILLTLHKRGDKLPKGWKDDVIRYIRRKREAVNEAKVNYMLAKNQLDRTIAIARQLGVRYEDIS